MKWSLFIVLLPTFLMSIIRVPVMSQQSGSDILSSDDKEGLVLMREEEKLARDVYSSLYARWNQPVFSRIMESEERHGEMVKSLLIRFGVEDPYISGEGQFSSSEVQTLYASWVDKGQKSLKDAFEVGAMIEDLDISDLDRLSESTQNAEIKQVYGLLNEGSQNHLRAFARQLDGLGVIYTPQYISPERWEGIRAANNQNGKNKGHHSGGDIVKSCAGATKGHSCHNNSEISSGQHGKSGCRKDQGLCQKKSESKTCCKQSE